MLAKLTRLVVMGGILSLSISGCGTPTGKTATDTAGSASTTTLAARGALSTNNAASPIGMNTNEVMESDASMPFIDLMRAAMPFEEASPWLTKGNVTYDANGWPNNLNGGQAGTRFLSNLPAAVIPEGTYTVLYDGEGDIQYMNDAALVERKAGVDTITIAAGSDGMLNTSLLITRSNPQNHLRNIRILPPGGMRQQPVPACRFRRSLWWQLPVVCRKCGQHRVQPRFHEFHERFPCDPFHEHERRDAQY